MKFKVLAIIYIITFILSYGIAGTMDVEALTGEPSSLTWQAYIPYINIMIGIVLIITIKVKQKLLRKEKAIMDEDQVKTLLVEDEDSDDKLKVKNLPLQEGELSEEMSLNEGE